MRLFDFDALMGHLGRLHEDKRYECVRDWKDRTGGLAVGFMLLSIMHGGIRLGRKVYLVDMADSTTRAAYVAVSNTVIGMLMLLGGLVGVLADVFGVAQVVLLLALMSLIAAMFIQRLPDVSLAD